MRLHRCNRRAVRSATYSAAFLRADFFLTAGLAGAAAVRVGGLARGFDAGPWRVRRSLGARRRLLACGAAVLAERAWLVDLGLRRLALPAAGFARFGGPLAGAAPARSSVAHLLRPARRASIALLERDRLRRQVARQCGVDAIMADIGPVAAALDHDRSALARMLAERAAGIGAEAALRGPLAIFSAISVTARLRPISSTSSPASRLA